jgi:hypothetical protein
MRWENLFDDLEHQLERELDAELRDQLREEERQRHAHSSLRERLLVLAPPRAPHPAEGIRVHLRHCGEVLLEPVTVGKDWMACRAHESARLRGSVLVPLGAILSLSLTPTQLAASLDRDLFAPSASSLTDRIGFGFVLRDLARRRRQVVVHASGQPRHGTLDRVATDHLDLAEHREDEARRTSAVSVVTLIPLADLAAIELR